jgi:hypothetical protein
MLRLAGLRPAQATLTIALVSGAMLATGAPAMALENPAPPNVPPASAPIKSDAVHPKAAPKKVTTPIKAAPAHKTAHASYDIVGPKSERRQ